MRKMINIILILLLICCLCACNLGGNTADVQIEIGESSIYEEAEIKQAVDEVIKTFASTFHGCNMTKLWYDEEISLEQSEEWAEHFNADSAIVLLSDFDVDESGGYGSFEPNSTYSNWNWVLVKDNDNDYWKLATWGYC